MADEEFLNEDEGAAAGDSAQAGKKVGLVPGFVIQILKWAALGLGAVIFIVTVVFFTVGQINAGNRAQTFQAVSVEYTARGPVLDWYKEIGEIRGRTADQVPHTVIADVHLGFQRGARRIHVELGDRTPEIRDLLRRYFTGKRSDELRPDHEDAMKAELRDKINAVMAEGRIERVIFEALNVVEF